MLEDQEPQSLLHSEALPAKPKGAQAISAFYLLSLLREMMGSDWQKYEERYRTGYYEEIIALGEATLPPLLGLLRNREAVEFQAQIISLKYKNNWRAFSSSIVKEAISSSNSQS